MGLKITSAHKTLPQIRFGLISFHSHHYIGLVWAVSDIVTADDISSMFITCQGHQWALHIHYEIVPFTSLTFPGGLLLHLRQDIFPVLDVKALHNLIPSATTLHLAQYLLVAMTLFLLIKHQTDAYPRTFTLASPCQDCSSSFRSEKNLPQPASCCSVALHHHHILNLPSAYLSTVTSGIFIYAFVCLLTS